MSNRNIKNTYKPEYSSDNKDSRYNNFTRLVEESGDVRLESTARRYIPTSDQDKFHTVTMDDGHRLDLVAYKYYNNVNLWWVIASANSIKNPMSIEVGTVLRIPATQTLFGYKGVLVG